MEDVGRFGTVSLLDASTGNAITAFGIDTSPVTFGSDPSCTVRLFYPSISASHAHITFHDLKAFLVVSGPTGIEVDGCKVYPPSTIPLPNRTEFKLAGKRFMFSYPPKEMRRVLIESPVKPRAVRMSMVARAVIDSPSPPKGLIKDLGGGECVLLEDIPRPPSPSKGPPSLHKRVLMKNAKQAEDEMEELEVVGRLVAASDSESEMSISEGGDQSESDDEEVAQSEPMENVPSSEADPMDVEMNDEDEVVMPTTPKFAPTARFSFSSRPSLGGGPPQRCQLPRQPLNFALPVAVPATPQTNAIKKEPAWTTPKRKVVLTAEEKKAISERRRSALVAPDLFFAGRVPGLSPPKKASDNNPFASPTKNGQRSTLFGVREEVEEDSRVLLEKMRDAVEDMKMRRAVKAEEGERKVDVRFLRDHTVEAIDVDAEDLTIPKTPVRAASPAKSLLTTPLAASPSKPALVTPRATSPAKSLWPRATSPTKVVVTPRVYPELTSLVPTSPIKMIPQSPAKTIPKSPSKTTIGPGSPIKGTFNTPIRAAYPLKRTLSTPLALKTPKAAPIIEVKSPLKITWPYRSAEDHEKEQAMEKVEHIIAPVASPVEEVKPIDARGDEPMEEELTADKDVVSDVDEMHDEQLESVDECVTPSPKKRSVKAPTPPPQSDTETEQEQEQELDGPTPKRTVRGKRVRAPSPDADAEIEEVAPPKKATRGKRAATPTTEARPTRTRARTRTKTEPDDEKEKAKVTRPRTRAKTEEPEDQVPKKTRGRAKKAVAEVEAAEEEHVEVAPKKGRGRPKKVVEETTEDDEAAAPLKRTTRGRKMAPTVEDKPATRGKKPPSTVSGSTSDVEIVGETKPAGKGRKKVDSQEKENPPLAGVKEEEEDAGLGKGARTRTRTRARTRT